MIAPEMKKLGELLDKDPALKSRVVVAKVGGRALLGVRIPAGRRRRPAERPG